MVSTSEMIKGLNAFEELLKELQQLEKDAVFFIIEKEMHKEFLEYHFKKGLERKQ